MESKINTRLRLLSYVVIAYMLLAFAWWSVLLYIKNEDAFQAKAQFLKIQMVANGDVRTEEEFLATEAYQELRKSYQRQEWMIMGEATVFVISLVIGVWLINRGYNKEMMAANQRRNFLLSITHELKSPIASIRLVLDTFRKRQLSPEQLGRLTQNALADTERLNGLVNDLLLSAKLETAYQIYEEQIDLEDMSSTLVNKLQDKYPKVHFTFESCSHIPMISGDRTGLTSVILNLLENAVKYAAEAPVIHTRLCAEGHSIMIEVADNGIGIEEKEKKKIFEKFYRVGNEDTRKTKGTGLGLYIVDQIVRAHGGRISVADNQPRGTVFTIKIPANLHRKKRPGVTI